MPLRPVTIHRAHPRLRFDRRSVARVIHTLDGRFQKSKTTPVCPPGGLSLAFLTDAALAKLHADFLADPTPTDVITFAGDPVHGLAGEICVSVDAALAQSRKRGGNFSAELTLYLVHGWLHLAGYDDLFPAKKRVMRRAEAHAMKLLHGAGALPVFSLHRARTCFATQPTAPFTPEIRPPTVQTTRDRTHSGRSMMAAHKPLQIGSGGALSANIVQSGEQTSNTTAQ